MSKDTIVSRTDTADVGGMRARAFGEHTRRRLLSVAGLAAGVVALTGCAGMTAQQVAANVVNMFQTAVTTVTAFLSQMGIAVPANILALVAKMQSVAQQVVAGITAVAASGAVQQAFTLFTQVTGAVTAVFAGNVPGFVSGAINAITTAFKWIYQALGLPTTSAMGAAAPMDPNAILNNLRSIIAAVPR